MSEQAGQSSWSLGGLLNYAQQTVNRLEGGGSWHLDPW